jgi:hypothetical protein
LRPIELVEHDPRLDDAGSCLDIDTQQMVAVLRPIDDDRGVRALPGEAGASAAREDRHVVLPADRDRLNRRVHCARHHDI